MSKVLYVEDNKDMRELMSYVLESENYEVETACNGQEALLALQSSSLPDVILLDHNMDIMSGPEFLDELEKNHNHLFLSIPIVLMTALDRCFVKTNKATEILTKKGDIVEILLVVKKYCKKP